MKSLTNKLIITNTIDIIPTNFKYFNSTKTIIFFCLIARTIQLIFLYNMLDDNSYAVIAMQNLVDGNGYSLKQVFSNDLSQIRNLPLQNWPPGYSIILAPFYIIFKHNYLAAAITVDLLFGSVLIFYSRKILLLFKIPDKLIALYLVMTSLFIYSFYIIPSTDAICASLCIIATYYTLRSYHLTKSRPTYIAAISISLFMCGMLKYLFIPLIFILPFFMIVSGRLKNEKSLLKAGIIIFLFLLFFIGCFLVYQKSIFGSTGYISATGRGFYPTHLLNFFPLVPASLIKQDTIQIITGIDFSYINIIYQIIHLISCIILIIIAIKLFRIGINNFNSVIFFYFIFIVFLLFTTIILGYLSLNVEKEEIVPGKFWTYIEEPRYYSVVTVFFHLLIFLGYYQFRNYRNRLIQYIFIFLLGTIGIESIRGSIFLFNRINNFKQEEYSWQRELRFQQFADQLIQKEQLKWQEQNIAVTSSLFYYASRVSIYNKIPLLWDASIINDISKIKTKQPVILMVIIKEDHKETYKSFLDKNTASFIGKFDECTFYSIYISPSK